MAVLDWVFGTLLLLSILFQIVPVPLGPPQLLQLAAEELTVLDLPESQEPQPEQPEPQELQPQQEPEEPPHQEAQPQPQQPEGPQQQEYYESSHVGDDFPVL